MNMPSTDITKFIMAATATFVLAGCATAPSPPDGAAAARTRLTQLQANAALASRAPIEIADADLAVTAAERRQPDAALGQHLVLIADHEVDIATAWAQARLYEDQRADLSSQAEAARLDARTRELGRARDAASAAQADATIARGQADRARGDAAAARIDAGLAQNEAAVARQEAGELQRELTELSARSTDRGLVVTLGDVLFETGQSALSGGTTADLDTLAGFLGRYEDRSVLIEGHTDSVGSESSNLDLSRRRADAVLAYLMQRGINGSRLTAIGMGEANPVADNAATTGRQQNRRVEVIISNNVAAAGN